MTNSVCAVALPKDALPIEDERLGGRYTAGTGAEVVIATGRRVVVLALDGRVCCVDLVFVDCRL